MLDLSSSYTVLSLYRLPTVLCFAICAQFRFKASLDRPGPCNHVSMIVPNSAIECRVALNSMA